jgi:hypothetical protein
LRAGRQVQRAQRLQEYDFIKECSRDSIIKLIIVKLRDSDEEPG